MQERMKARGVVVLGVSIDADEEAYHRFLKLRNVNFMTVRDPEEKVATLYGTSGWPETYVIDRKGVLRRKFVGPVDWTSPEVMDFLSKL
jgi:peroxiredoxin